MGIQSNAVIFFRRVRNIATTSGNSYVNSVKNIRPQNKLGRYDKCTGTT